jgi:hypothetical protein
VNSMEEPRRTERARRYTQNATPMMIALLHQVLSGSSKDIPDGFQDVCCSFVCHIQLLVFVMVSNVHCITVFINFTCEKPDTTLDTTSPIMCQMK